MNRPRLACLGASALVLGFAGSAGAQEAAPRALTENEAVALAVADNPTLHVALLRATQSRYLLAVEQAQYTPIFDANAGYTRLRSPSLSGRDAVRVGGSDVVDIGAGITKPFSFGTVLSASLGGRGTLRTAQSDVVVPLDQDSRGPGYSFIGRLDLLQPLLRGAGNDVGLASLRQAKLSLGASELQAQEAASVLLADVVSAYWELWYAAEVERINQASRELARAQQAQAAQQVASGALAPASAFPYATRVAELEETVLGAQTQRRQRELGLWQLLGQPGGADVSLGAAQAPEPPQADEPALGTATNEALASSYARKQLQAELAIAKDQLRTVGDPLRPRLDLDAYVQAEGLGNRQVPPAFERFGKLEALSAHVGLTFETPISDTRRTAQLQAAQLASHVAEKRIRERELSIQSSVASAIAERRAARQRLELSSQTEKVARQQAEAERARFLAGGSIALVVQEAEDSLRQAELRAQRAKVDLVLADLTLLELRGQLLARYSSAVARLPAASRVTLTRTHTDF